MYKESILHYVETHNVIVSHLFVCVPDRHMGERWLHQVITKLDWCVWQLAREIYR